MRTLAFSVVPLLLCSFACSDDAGSAPSQTVSSGVPGMNLPVDDQAVQADSPEPATMPSASNTSEPLAPAQAEGTAEGTPELSASELSDQSPDTSGQAESSEDEVSDAETTDAETDEPVEETQEEEPSSAEVVTSPGCGNASPATQGLSIAANGQQAPYEVTLPPNYDPNVATPMVFAFHGRNRTHEQLRDVDAGQIQNELGNRAIMVYLKSVAGTGWNSAAEVQPNVDIFDALYPQVLEDYCVNPTEVFAIGHSSGGFFSNILACRFPERFRGIGTVAGATQECSGQVPAILVHGTTDTVVGFDRGVASRDGYLAGNGCSQATQAVGIDACIAYQQCDEGLPVQWCEHTEPTYSDNNGPTNHGWPSFASRALGSFLFGLLDN